MFPIQEEDGDRVKWEPVIHPQEPFPKGSFLIPGCQQLSVTQATNCQSLYFTEEGDTGKTLGRRRVRGSSFRNGQDSGRHRDRPLETPPRVCSGRTGPQVASGCVTLAFPNDRALLGWARPPGSPWTYPWSLTEDTRLLWTLENPRHSPEPRPPPDIELLAACPGGRGGLLPWTSEGHGDGHMGGRRRSWLSWPSLSPCDTAQRVPACPACPSLGQRGVLPTAGAGRAAWPSLLRGYKRRVLTSLPMTLSQAPRVQKATAPQREVL